MSRVIKLRLGARQARSLWWLLRGTADSTEDDGVRGMCERVMKQLGAEIAADFVAPKETDR